MWINFAFDAVLKLITNIIVFNPENHFGNLMSILEGMIITGELKNIQASANASDKQQRFICTPVSPVKLRSLRKRYIVVGRSL